MSLRKSILALAMVLGLTSPTLADTALDSVYYDAGQPGRGFGLEIANQSHKVFGGFFGYDSAGAAKWYIFQSTMSGDVMSSNARLQTCTGGPVFGGPIKTATCVDAGAAALAVARSSSGTYSAAFGIGSTTINTTQFRVEQGVFSGFPATGWYYDAAKPGTGLFIEIRGTTSNPTVFLAYYGYAASGAAVWYVSEGTPLSANGVTLAYDGYLTRCPTGQPLGGNYATPSCLNGGAVSLRMTSTSNGTITWPDGTTSAVNRYDVSAQ